jgi:DNA adenine methylase
LKPNPLKWHGGKSYLANWILGFEPKDCVHYVEPYFGGGAVLFAREPGKSEYVNDLNSNLTLFWRYLQDPVAFDVLKRRLEATPLSEREFKKAQDILASKPRPADTTERAWAFFVVARQSRQGLLEDFATMSRNRTRRGMNEQASSWLSAIEGLPDAHERLRGVVVACKPALEVIRQQDGPKTWFYLDPPYLHETRTATDAYSRFEMGFDDHVELLETLTGISGKFALSGYPSALYNDFASSFGWRMESTVIDNKSSSKKKKDSKVECLWMNY